MSDALIGYTGFVGGNLLRQRQFDVCYNSANIEEIAGRQFRLLVCSGMPAVKWLANREPERDAATLDRLWSNLRQVRAETVVILSTVDVYPTPAGVDEATPIDVARLHAYGKHRLLLEQRAREHFPTVLVMRLPGLFGAGLKKNIIYDFLHDHQTENIHADAAFQFYDLEHLGKHLEQALEHRLDLLNVATEPVRVGEVARQCFGREFHNRPSTCPAGYDFRTRHAALFGGRSGYLMSKEQVLADLKRFVAAQGVLSI